MRRPSIGAFVAGFLVALVLNFAIALGSFSSGGRSILDLLIAWGVTVVVFGVLFRMHPWAAYGALGGYVALFTFLVLAGGATGPYFCFSAYGYPSPSR